MLFSSASASADASTVPPPGPVSRLASSLHDDRVLTQTLHMGKLKLHHETIKKCGNVRRYAGTPTASFVPTDVTHVPNFPLSPSSSKWD